MKALRLGWFVCGALIASAGCGGPKDSPTAGGTPAPKLLVGIVFDSGGRGDKSFNDSAWAGVERAKSELGIEVKAVESKSEKDYEPNLQALGEEGCDLIVGVGGNMQAAMAKVCPSFPEVKFALVDAAVDAANVRSILFKEEEGSFLAGYLAGLMTQTGKIGFVGGMEFDIIKRFHSGYAAGAKTANPACEVLPAKYTGSWDNIDYAKVAANSLFNAGADIVYHAAGRAGLGVIGAAKEQGKYAIGVDGDQDGIAEGSVLTSMVKRVDEGVFQTVKDVAGGTFSAGTVTYDLAAGGVGLSEMRFTKDLIGSGRLAKLAEVKAKIVSGELKVPSTPEELADYLESRE